MSVAAPQAASDGLRPLSIAATAFGGVRLRYMRSAVTDTGTPFVTESNTGENIGPRQQISLICSSLPFVFIFTFMRIC